LTCHKYDRLPLLKSSTFLAKFSTDLAPFWAIWLPTFFQKSEKSAIFGRFLAIFEVFALQKLLQIGGSFPPKTGRLNRKPSN
jgi:hypothetical protein